MFWLKTGYFPVEFPVWILLIITQCCHLTPCCFFPPCISYIFMCNTLPQNLKLPDIVSVGQEFMSGLVEWLWLRVCQEVALKCKQRPRWLKRLNWGRAFYSGEAHSHGCWLEAAGLVTWISLAALFESLHILAGFPWASDLRGAARWMPQCLLWYYSCKSHIIISSTFYYKWIKEGGLRLHLLKGRVSENL